MVAGQPKNLILFLSENTSAGLRVKFLKPYGIMDKVPSRWHRPADLFEIKSNSPATKFVDINGVDE